MDSLYKSGQAIFRNLNSYGKYLRSFFLDDNDDIDFAFVELKEFIPHQGNGYDCGCHVIWNMIQYICGIESYRVIPANIPHPPSATSTCTQECGFKKISVPMSP